MTNNSLNGALRQLGETMASNLTAQGVPSTYDEGLTTLAGKILDIQGGGTFDDISVSSTQDILSYADGDSTVLSAQLTSSGSPVSVSGESVTFEVRKVSDDSLVETLTDTTDSNGEASVEYFGKGTGDLYIEVSCRTLSKTYSTIQDCIKCYSGEITSTITPNLTLPSSYQIEYDIIKKANSGGSAIRLWIGNSSKSGQFGFNSGADTSLVIYNGETYTTFSGGALNDWTKISVKIDGTNNLMSMTGYGSTQSLSIPNNLIITNLYQIQSHTGATIRNVKIKPL